MSACNGSAAVSNGLAGLQRRSGFLVLLGGLGSIGFVPGAATAQTAGLYDTSRVLEHLGSECGGQPSCITIESKQRRVAPGQRDVFRVRCPGNHPHVVGWDTEQHEHIATMVVLDDLPSTSGGTFTRIPTPERLLKVVAENKGDAVGFVTIFLGCSAEQSRTTSFGHMRSGVPSSLQR
jgi:hypothetical protein